MYEILVMTIQTTALITYRWDQNDEWIAFGTKIKKYSLSMNLKILFAFINKKTNINSWFLKTTILMYPIFCK